MVLDGKKYSKLHYSKSSFWVCCSSLLEIRGSIIKHLFKEMMDHSMEKLEQHSIHILTVLQGFCETTLFLQALISK